MRGGVYRMMARALYLGLDSSSQGLKASAIDCHLQVVYTSAINYDRDLPEYKTTQGVHDHGNATVTTPTLMLAHAVDALFDQMKEDQFPFHEVVAISGSGQQHGSVYWAQGSRGRLASLTAEETLHGQLRGCFSTPDSPIWMDSSTTEQCRTLEAAVGGAEAMAALTGSRAYERFTANQILKIRSQRPADYDATERISLISSFMCSLLLGNYAPIDTSDAAGMNLMDLKTMNWAKDIVDAIDPRLPEKLGTPVAASSVAGTISPFFVGRYGFSPACYIVAWSGDNPNSVAGLCLSAAGDVGLSLGTSDTIFSIVPSREARPGLEGHFFPNPIDTATHMAMLCYKNGSLAREKVAKRVADGSWEEFERLVTSVPTGNDGHVGLFIDKPEIIPFIPKTGVYRFDPSGARVDAFPSPAHEARAVLESQFLSMRLHKEALGLSPKRILVTGGASSNHTICQVIADVFGCEVFASPQTDSASLGAAYRAKHADMCNLQGQMVPFVDGLLDITTRHMSLCAGANDAPVVDPRSTQHKVASPNKEHFTVYTKMLGRYKELEAAVVSEAMSR